MDSIPALLPLTYGADILHGAIHGGNVLPLPLNFFILTVFCDLLFFISIRNIHKKWIT